MAEPTEAGPRERLVAQAVEHFGRTGLGDRSLRGIAEDNQKQIGPALAKLTTVTGFLKDRQRLLRAILKDLAPYTNILGNIIGTGPWFDAYVVNLLALPTGEFVPGKR